MTNPYDTRYATPEYYWGTKPSALCLRVLDLLPPDQPLRLLDVGCGEGRNAVFFARNGYEVIAFDSSPKGLEKTRLLAERTGVGVEVFQADVNEYRPAGTFDVVFSTGVLHYVPPEVRPEILRSYREATAPGGLNALSVFVDKPFVAPAPDAEPTAHPWISGEVLTHYRDWRIEFCLEEVFDCTSGGVPHQHAVDRMVARKIAGR
jgi:tellurite methyltransferase